MASTPLRPAALVALSAVLLHGALLAVFVSRNKGDVSCLLCASAINARGRAPFEAVTVGFGEPGYDGQSYYAVARDPWRLHRGENVDPPVVWHQRIVYPLLCWVCSGGDGRLLLWTMPGLNLLAVGVLTWMGSLSARRHGRSAWWGFVLPLAVNAVLPALRNLTDVVSTVAVLGLLTAWLRGARLALLFAWALVAQFTREQNLAVVGLVLIASFGSRHLGTTTLLAVVPLLWLVWVALLGHLYGEWPFVSTSGNLGRPCAGLVDGFDHWSQYRGHWRARLLVNASLWHFVLLLSGAVVAALRCGSPTLALFTLGGVALAVLGGPAFYCDPFSYRRVLVWHSLGLWLYGVRGGGRWSLALVAVSGVWSWAAAFRII